MAYTATDGFQTTTTLAMPIGSLSLPLLNNGNLCSATVLAPAWVMIKSANGVDVVKITSCTSGVPTITATTRAHPVGSCVQGFTLPPELLCAILKSTGCIADCAPLTVVV